MVFRMPTGIQDPYAEGFELCCIAQWFVNHGRLQLAVSYAEAPLGRMGWDLWLTMVNYG